MKLPQADRDHLTLLVERLEATYSPTIRAFRAETLRRRVEWLIANGYGREEITAILIGQKLTSNIS